MTCAALKFPHSSENRPTKDPPSIAQHSAVRPAPLVQAQVDTPSAVLESVSTEALVRDVLGVLTYWAKSMKEATRMDLRCIVLRLKG